MFYINFHAFLARPSVARFRGSLSLLRLTAQTMPASSSQPALKTNIKH